MTPPLTPDEQVAAGGEREVLETFLDLYRGIVVRKVAGLSAEAACRRLVPSPTTLAGLVRHLASVEREWFLGVLDGRPAAEAGVRDDDGWTVDAVTDVDDLVADYERACAESRRVAARFALDDTVPMPRLGRVSLRWIYVHLIEETARHAGHADILREQSDGATGFDG
ncbi:DinB family protein [Amycolatopsis mongoliensis]|uniref:DinB family protein n=1 Tax=Amycolatopsis mongoliensis TaxID=715475 RepID=A0A9Y2JK95_9PSEU|nr:DinB family protein [Amycolatopsis sp. 4-36]WIX98941.1 DinB family protein [Amycolatopsis sp. 4-36]